MAGRTRGLRRRRFVVLAVFFAFAMTVVPAHAEELTRVDIAELQTLLTELGYPVGPVDGIDGRQTRRGLCAWRRLEGHDVHRGPATPDELAAIRSTSELPDASDGIAITVDKTCQALYLQVDGRWQHVAAASTGRGGLPRQGDYNITWKRSGWHTSTLYPAPTPNMYNTLYFRGPIAIHGSHVVPPYPASAGCVRVTPETADLLFDIVQRGDPVQIVGAF